MNHKHKRSRKKPQVIRVWTYSQAKKALPYIGSVMRSLREHWLDTQRHLSRKKQLERRPGKPDRATLIAQEDTTQEGQKAMERFNDAFQELQEIEVFCVDPNQGAGVIPFVHDEKLAWFIYDMFDANDFQHWRYHDDPLDERRPIAAALADQETQNLAV